MAKQISRMGLVRRGYSPTGGAEKYLVRFAEGLKARNVETVLFTTSEWPAEQSGPFSEVVRLSDNGPEAFAGDLRRVKPKDKCDLVFSLERIRDCDFYRAGDGVHRAYLDRARKLEGGLRAKLREMRPKNQQLLRLEREIFKPEGGPSIIANAEFIRHEIEQYYGTPRDRVHVVYNGYDPVVFEQDPREEMRAELGLKKNETMLLFTGSGWKRKGLRYAVEATWRLQAEGVRLFIAGKGKVKAGADERVTFLGPVKDMPRLYAAADLFILPTLYDPFSNACLEAAAYGIPVITTTANGFSEIMHHRFHGHITENPADVKDLVAGIKRWLEPGKMEKARPVIREWASEFSLARNVKQTLGVLLREAAPSSPGTHPVA